MSDYDLPYGDPLADWYGGQFDDWGILDGESWGTYAPNAMDYGFDSYGFDPMSLALDYNLGGSPLDQLAASFQAQPAVNDLPAAIGTMPDIVTTAPDLMPLSAGVGMDSTPPLIIEETRAPDYGMPSGGKLGVGGDYYSEGKPSIGYVPPSDQAFQESPGVLGALGKKASEMWEKDPIMTALLGMGLVSSLLSKPKTASVGRMPTPQNWKPFPGVPVMSRSLLNTPRVPTGNYGLGAERLYFDRPEGRFTMSNTGNRDFMTPYKKGGKVTESPQAAGYLQGDGGGQDDILDIKAAPGEYVFDAETVSMLGDGNNEEGARKLDEFRMAIRAHKRNTPLDEIPPKAKDPAEYLEGDE